MSSVAPAFLWSRKNKVGDVFSVAPAILWSRKNVGAECGPWGPRWRHVWGPLEPWRPKADLCPLAPTGAFFRLLWGPKGPMRARGASLELPEPPRGTRGTFRQPWILASRRLP